MVVEAWHLKSAVLIHVKIIVCQPGIDTCQEPLRLAGLYPRMPPPKGPVIPDGHIVYNKVSEAQPAGCRHGWAAHWVSCRASWWGVPRPSVSEGLPQHLMPLSLHVAYRVLFDHDGGSPFWEWGTAPANCWLASGTPPSFGRARTPIPTGVVRPLLVGAKVSLSLLGELVGGMEATLQLLCIFTLLLPLLLGPWWWSEH